MLPVLGSAGLPCAFLSIFHVTALHAHSRLMHKETERREGGEKSTETHKKIAGTIETNLEKRAEHQDALKTKKKPIINT